MLERRVTTAGIVHYISPLLERASVPHAFSTRIGGRAGTSPPPFDSFNLGNPSGVEVQDDYERIYRHYKALQTTIGCAGRKRCWVHQVHGGNVVTIRRGDGFVSGPQADAMVSDDSSHILSVRVADCVPVLLASDDGRVVAAVHSGWRGVIANLVSNALDVMRQLTDRRIIAAIGPCIGFEAFEVGPEVLEQFVTAFGPSASIRRQDDGKGNVDLRAIIALQLENAGMSSDCIDSTDLCTVRDADEFYSHRRDGGTTGRMAALISPRA